MQPSFERQSASSRTMNGGVRVVSCELDFNIRYSRKGKNQTIKTLKIYAATPRTDFERLSVSDLKSFHLNGQDGIAELGANVYEPEPAFR